CACHVSSILCLFFSFSFYCSRHHRDLHSFPTRRSSDLLGFFVQPNSADAGHVITPPVEIVAQDSVGGTDSSFTGSITISFSSNSTGASLSGTTVVRPVKGIASFGNLVIDKTGTYTLQAGTSGATAVVSNAFTISTPNAP